MPTETDRTGEELAVPRVGMLTMLTLVITLLMQATFGYWVLRHNTSSFGLAGWVGMMWFGAMAANHLCFTPPVRWRWIGLGTAAFIWHVLLMTICMQEELLRYVLLFGAVTVVQLTMILAAGLPAWEGPGSDLVVQRQKHRFTIRSIILSTTVIAILLAAARHYAIAFMVIPLAAIPLFVLLWFLTASTMLAWQYQRWRAVIVVVVLIGGSLLFTWTMLAWQDIAQRDPSVGGFLGALRDGQPTDFWIQMHLVSFAIFTLAASMFFGFGRLDARDHRLQAKRGENRLTGSPENLTER